jgi:hypothetical protein
LRSTLTALAMSTPGGVHGREGELAFTSAFAVNKVCTTSRRFPCDAMINAVAPLTAQAKARAGRRKWVAGHAGVTTFFAKSDELAQSVSLAGVTPHAGPFAAT